jgi:hypothetical protein
MLLFDIFTKLNNLKNQKQHTYQNGYKYNTNLKINRNLVSNMPPLFSDKYADIHNKIILQKKIKHLFLDTDETSNASKVITFSGSGFNAFIYCCISFFVIIPIRKYYLTYLVI